MGKFVVNEDRFGETRAARPAENGGEQRMTCKDCYHYDVCCELMKQLHWKPELCNSFKDKSLIVELPCKVGDKVYYISTKRPSPSIYEIAEAEALDYNINRYGLRAVKIRPLNSLNSFNSFTISAGEVYSTKSKAEARLKELK